MSYLKTILFITLLCGKTTFAGVVGDFVEFNKKSNSILSKGYYVVTPHASNTTLFIDNNGEIVADATFPGSLWLSEVNKDGSMTGIISQYKQLMGVPGNQSAFHITSDGEMLFDPDELFYQLSTKLNRDGFKLLTIHHDFQLLEQSKKGIYKYVFLAKSFNRGENLFTNFKKNKKVPNHDFLVKATYNKSLNRFYFEYTSILSQAQRFTGKTLKELLKVRCEKRGKEAWLHTNSISVKDDNYYLSLRNINAVAVFSNDLKLKKIITLENAKEMHDVVKLTEGYTYFHNNVCNRNTQVVTADNAGRIIDKHDLGEFSAAYGSFQSLPEGGSLVCNGTTGEIYEYSKDWSQIAKIQIKPYSYIVWVKDRKQKKGLFKQRKACYRAQKVQNLPFWVR
jgi:hypothetical protein